MSEKKTPVFPVMSKAVKSLFENGPPSAADIDKFQEKFWEQMVASFSPALKVIDIHDISRHSVLWNINDRLLEVVKSRIQEYPVGDDKNKNLWKRLLANASSFIHHQYMRGTIMMVLSKVPNIRDKYISLIVNHDSLYEDAPLPVLRQIWMNEGNNKFKEEVVRVIHSYQTAFSDALLEAVLASVSCSSSDTLPILFWPPRRRRRDPHLLRLIEMIGDNRFLYEKALQIFRNEHAKHQQLIEKSATRRATFSSPELPVKSASKKKEDSLTSVHHVFIPPALLPTTHALAASVLCTLRFDLLMGLNEAKSETIFQSDKIHRFVWGMDACIRNKEIDRRHAKDLLTSVGLYQSHSNSGRRPSTSALAGEVGLDQDNSEDWAPDVEEKGNRKKSGKSFSKPGDKRPFTEVDSDPEISKAIDQEGRKIKMDIQMICRDPWVVFTICSTLLKIVIKNGLSEDKLPRNLPDVPFLVDLLMRGLENDLSPPDVIISRDTSAKGESKNKRPRKQQSGVTQLTKVDPATALITQVLPAAAQLHLTTWRNQLFESIRGIVNQIRSKAGPAATPVQWQKRFDSCQYTPLTVSPAYLAHPIGHLFIQYHALFALERREWTVLRALLKAAISAAQAKFTKVAPRLGKVASNQASPSAYQPTVGFRWRPECLQAIAIGIASLPVSSEEPAKGSRNRVPTSDDRSGVMDKSNTSVTTEAPSVASVSFMGGTTSPSVITDSIGSNASLAVTRAELASLLRNTLPLQSDLQLLVLAQCAKLVPMVPVTPTTPGSAGAATPMPNFFATSGDVPVVPRGSSERERMMNALSRHIEFTVNQESEDDPVISSAATTANMAINPGGFKSTNSKVLEAFEWLKKDMERSSSAGMIPMMGTSKPACGKSMTPLSPFDGSLQPSQYGMLSPSRLMPPPTRFAPRTARYAPNAFPMATPLTNPGLSIPPPLPPSGGQMSLSPLADYRPLSPGVGTSSSPSLGSSGSSYPTYATPLAADAGEGGLANYVGSTSPTGGDLRRYAAAPIENRSPSPPPLSITQPNSPPSP